jgi:antitoxin component YwqK of YwqJK toxin-antitoxin module
MKDMKSVIGMIKFCYLLIIGSILLLLIFQSCTEKIKRTYYENGEIHEIIELKNDKYHGLGKEFNEQGCLVKEFYYKDNVLDSTYIEYYENGSKKFITYFKNGVQNGVQTHYYESGNIKEKGVLKNGISQGARYYFYDQKDKVKAVYYFYDDMVMRYVKLSLEGDTLEAKNYANVKVIRPVNP